MVTSLDIHGDPYTAENVEIMSDPVENFLLILNWQTLHLFIRKKILKPKKTIDQ